MSGVFLRLLTAVLSLFVAGSVVAQDLGALARFEAGEITDRWRGTEVRLELSQGVPWRLFTLTAPNRLVLDFREVQWGDADPVAINTSDRIATVRMGGYRPGWSRFVAELAEPMIVENAELATGSSDGGATLVVRLDRTDQSTFDQTAGAPRDPRWDLPEPASIEALPQRDPDRLRVVLDPGHGGIDPGAERDGITEADLMLIFGRELQDVLRRAGGFDVILTRDGDYFVSLEARVAHARDAGADIFISLHADALAQGEARGAAVYVLSDDASDAASAALAERHNRDDLLAGIDLSQSDDRVANVLMSLARLDNAPRSEALAKHMLDGIRNAVGRVHKRPLRSAGFSVLKAADIPSVLLEVGFLSTEEDLKNLSDPIWRQSMAAGIRDGIIAWRDEDSALAPLRRN
ncbi:N-acetylmuramoyl-L-alanine amidase [Marivita sp. XM-24bin2]|jgi:N-acetylmuramoyl-L-alanine amidase|uniref:N-acetylmuramoyl-L-alanine amidase n=1 Tax=unclassified Marivita TaxID=2632480 RepID=UPI000D7A5B7F|nr:N-acetylmuramoyl-L-alanine amidase [Marivita sp. XM-24bin2]PWL36041.1 MAG: N-acetylmuramoyl-L-alanine amidase [Marivita sp. XM-24bin2]